MRTSATRSQATGSRTVRGPRIRLGRNRRTVRAPAAERRASWRRRARWVAASVVVLCGAGGASAGLYYGWDALVHSQRLVLRTIEVAGTHRVSRQELEAYAGVQAGMAILDLDLDALALKVRRHPWVAEATVRRRLPDALRIDVREHEPAIVVALGDLYLADSSGHVFGRLRGGDKVTLPVLSGLERADAARQPSELAMQIREALDIVAAIGAQRSVLGRLEELRRDEDLGWTAMVVDETARPLTLHLGAQPTRSLGEASRAVALVAARGVRPEVVWAEKAAGTATMQVRLAQR
ncbi:MAG: FtsQ-type POTRA domain-containing protein, partial [Myxococcota bacterium]